MSSFQQFFIEIISVRKMKSTISKNMLRGQIKLGGISLKVK
jgi:hypothetical protein